MWLPMRDELDEVFRRDRSIGLKVVVAAAATVFVVVGGTLKSHYRGQLGLPVTTTELILLGIGSAVLGACLALSLSLSPRDMVLRRLDRGARVNSLLALIFGSRVVGIALLAVFVGGAILAFGG